MSRSRLEILLSYYRDDPEDPFNLYALALEYEKYDRAKAKEFFDALLNAHEDYVPVYYHAARFYQAMGDKHTAIKTYEKGITVAEKMNDAKALRELRSAYQELLYE